MSIQYYSNEELYKLDGQKQYYCDASEAAFLLGGIGTGNFSIGARGELMDWEIFNRPGKGNCLPYTFFAIWAKTGNNNPVAKILESKIRPPYSASNGLNAGIVSGLQRFESSTLKGEYPFVTVDFEDQEIPVKVSLEAFTPFIPLNADDSGIPAVVFTYSVTNTSNEPAEVTIAGSLANASEYTGFDRFQRLKTSENVKNKFHKDDNISGLFFTPAVKKPFALNQGSLALMTECNNITYKETWLEGAWWDGIQDFWDDFSSDGLLEAQSTYSAEGNNFYDIKAKVGSIGICHKLKSGEEKKFRFIISWHFPYRVKSWNEDYYAEGEAGNTVSNYYSTIFTDAWMAGKYLFNNYSRLEGLSRQFQHAFFGTTIPSYVLETVSAGITVLRSPTCFRIENGFFLGYEGCYDTKGACPGNCTHVWNYAQTVAFLFPELEQTMRKIEFNLETDDTGKMEFRAMKIFGRNDNPYYPAVDGQTGTIIRLYRDWKFSGNDSLLKETWEKASSALDFAFTYWDSDSDYVLDNQQHNTYDIEFHGPNSLSNSMFYTALKAGIEMASYLGDVEHENKYKIALNEGSSKMDNLLWNGEYYIQLLNNINQYRYQYGSGCLSDQIFGQLLAHITNLGYILPEDHVKKAIKSVFEYNFRGSFNKHENVQRTYALNNEKGLLLCSWPKGGRPRLPFVYSQEVWTGIEYQVAAHLIYEGFIEEGLTIVKAISERYNGYNRNPWDEVECGHHYARSMSSWAVFIALSGYRCDMVKKTMRFDPVINKNNFSTFWSTGTAWGIYKQEINPLTREIEWNINTIFGNIDGVDINT